MPNILLDRDETADSVKGYRIIETEVDFLNSALSGDALLIRGYALCEWAESFYRGRNITCTSAPSIVGDLMRHYSDLSIEQAQYISQKLKAAKVKIVDYSPQEILSSLFHTYLWDSSATKSHAADWLLWLDTIEYHEAFEPVLSPLVFEWKKDQPELSELYEANTPESSMILLQKWFGAEITPFLDKYGEFPTQVPDKWLAKLQEAWAGNMIKTRGEFFIEFFKAPTKRELKQEAAKVALDYFEKNPEFVTADACNKIFRFATGKDVERIAKLRPIPEPKPMPQQPESVIEWFTEEYLPYKDWCLNTGNNTAYAHSLSLGRQFAEWYLNFYPTALNSKAYISYFYSQNLREKYPNSINLLVVLDGLHYLDAKFLMNALLGTKGTHRLDIVENSPCFAPIPTVTEFTKGSLLRGVQPSMMKEIKILGEDVSEQETPVKNLKLAQPGDLIIWRIQEPDNTYHKKNKNNTLKTEIEGQLRTQAKKILDVIEQIPLSMDVKLFISTDHGRYLGTSKRVVPIPEGMLAHGRAAWGKTVNEDFPKSGYVINENVAYLSQHRFGLDTFGIDVAVILDDSAFQDKRHEQELYPHGGLSPEEVIVPWMVFARNVESPKVELAISGDGAANQPGKLILTAINSSQVNLHIVQCEIDFGDNKMTRLDKRHLLPSLRETTIEIDISSWPSSEQVKIGTAYVVLALPSGDEFEQRPSLSHLKVTELYTRDKSLLEGLDL